MLSRLSMPEHFRDLCDVSELVTAYLEDELYEDEFNVRDDYSSKDLLRTCYGILLSELEDYGIVTNSIHEDITLNFYDCKYYYHLKHFLSPSELIRYLSVSKDLVTTVDNIVNNNEIVDPFMFQDLLEVILQYHNSNEELNALDELVFEFTVNDKFYTYIRNIVNLITKEELTLNIPNVDRAKRYIDKINGLRIYARKAVNIILDKMPNLVVDRNKIEKLLQDYDRDKLTPDEIKIYSLIDLDEVPECLAGYRNTRMQIHHERSPHHVEYWVAPYKHPLPVPTVENLILIVAHNYEPDATQDTFWKEFDEGMELLKPVFTSDQIVLMEEMANLLFPIRDSYLGGE